MKKIFFALSIAVVFLSSCEIELVEGRRHNHYRGWEHSHYPEHHEVYNHGYHHDAHGGEVIHERR